jgi:hypothetical protein
MASQRSKSVRARHGDKTFELTIRFFTDDIAEEGKIMPKHGWTNGAVRMSSNPLHRLKPKGGRPFNSLMELPGVIEKVLIENGIVLHASRKTCKLIR